jgi:hypothetical protein
MRYPRGFLPEAVTGRGGGKGAGGESI